MKTFSHNDVELAVLEIEEALGKQFAAAEQVGSSYILGCGKDLDILVWVHGDLVTGQMRLFAAGYIPDAKGYDPKTFRSLRKGDVNVILTDDEDWFYSFLQAAEVCKALQLTEKWQRIAVHSIIRDDDEAEEAVRRAKEAGAK